MHRRGIVGVVVGGCGLCVVAACVGDDPVPVVVVPADAGIVGDAARDPDGGAEAATPVDSGLPCDLNAPWETPVPLQGVNSGFDEKSPTLTPDERTIYWASDALTDGGLHRIMVATRPDLSSAFADAKPISATVNVPEADILAPALSFDSRRLFFVAKAPDQSWDIYVAARNDTTKVTDWSLAQLSRVGFGTGAIAELSPMIGNDGTLYFTSNAAAVSDFDLYRASPFPDGGFTAPTRIDELGSIADDGNPVISFDGTTIWFSSARKGSADDDIWASTRPSVDASFSEPQKVAELNSNNRELPHWVSLDGCRLYLSSNRGGGSFDLYVASRKR